LAANPGKPAWLRFWHRDAGPLQRRLTAQLESARSEDSAPTSSSAFELRRVSSDDLSRAAVPELQTILGDADIR
jgi:hypothetical protein